MRLNYFGTDLHSAGHYFFQVTATGLGQSNVRFEKLPFNPEALPYPLTHDRGQVGKYHAFGFTLFVISGSVVDKRGGCKSVFFVEEEIIFDQLEELIRSTDFGKTVLETLIKPDTSIPPPPKQ